MDDPGSESHPLFAGTSSFTSPISLASMNMTNQFWKFHFDYEGESGEDNGRYRGMFLTHTRSLLQSFQVSLDYQISGILVT